MGGKSSSQAEDSQDGGVDEEDEEAAAAPTKKVSGWIIKKNRTFLKSDIFSSYRVQQEKEKRQWIR